MGAIEHLAIVALGADDAREGLLLSAEAHWNQNEADWRFFFTRGAGVGNLAAHQRFISTPALLPPTSSHAWIGMVRGTPNRRRPGLSTKLPDPCLQAAGG